MIVSQFLFYGIIAWVFAGINAVAWIGLHILAKNFIAGIIYAIVMIMIILKLFAVF